MKVYVVVAFACVLVFKPASAAGPSWNDLRVTFGINPLSTWDFDEMPRDLHGNLQSFTLKDDQCKDGDGTFLGQRYWYKSDPAVILLFDINGYIAGIQSSVPMSANWQISPKAKGTWVIAEADGSLTMTVYFVDPSIICTTGRSANDYASQGTGTDLYLQNGPKPLSGDVFKVPQAEADIKLTKWGFGKCFYLMGQHYWYNVSKDMNCDDFLPYCLLYNNGVLNAFCFAINDYITTTERYEHPTPKIAESFIDPVPACFYNTSSFAKLSTLHVYTTSNYLADRC